MYIADTANNRVAGDRPHHAHRVGHLDDRQRPVHHRRVRAGHRRVLRGRRHGDRRDHVPRQRLRHVGLDSAGNVHRRHRNNGIRELIASSNYNITDFGGGAGAFAAGRQRRHRRRRGPAHAQAAWPPTGHGDMFIADTGNNRVQEIAASSHTQFGITMTAGDVYTVAGSPRVHGRRTCGDGGPATAALLCRPGAVAVDAAGNLYIADTGNNRIQEIGAGTGDRSSTIAGSADRHRQGTPATAAPPASALLTTPQRSPRRRRRHVHRRHRQQPGPGDPAAAGHLLGPVHDDRRGHLHHRRQSPPGTPGHSGDAAGGTSALLSRPGRRWRSTPPATCTSPTTGNNRVQEVAAATGTQWGQSMTSEDIYTIAGSASGTAGQHRRRRPGHLRAARRPASVAVDSAGDLYIADAGNNRIQEIAAASGTQWGQSMTAGDIYTVAGSAARARRAPATAAPPPPRRMDDPPGIAVDPAGDLFITNPTSARPPRTGSSEITATATPLSATDQPRPYA